MSLSASAILNSSVVGSDLARLSSVKQRSPFLSAELLHEGRVLAAQKVEDKKASVHVRLNTRCHLLAFAAKVEKQLLATVSIQ